MQAVRHGCWTFWKVGCAFDRDAHEAQGLTSSRQLCQEKIRRAVVYTAVAFMQTHTSGDSLAAASSSCRFARASFPSPDMIHYICTHVCREIRGHTHTHTLATADLITTGEFCIPEPPCLLLRLMLFMFWLQLGKSCR